MIIIITSTVLLVIRETDKPRGREIRVGVILFVFFILLFWFYVLFNLVRIITNKYIIMNNMNLHWRNDGGAQTELS